MPLPSYVPALVGVYALLSVLLGIGWPASATHSHIQIHCDSRMSKGVCREGKQYRKSANGTLTTTLKDLIRMEMQPQWLARMRNCHRNCRPKVRQTTRTATYNGRRRLVSRHSFSYLVPTIDRTINSSDLPVIDLSYFPVAHHWKGFHNELAPLLLSATPTGSSCGGPSHTCTAAASNSHAAAENAHAAASNAHAAAETISAVNDGDEADGDDSTSGDGGRRLEASLSLPHTPSLSLSLSSCSPLHPPMEACWLPEFVDANESDPPEIYGCPRVRAPQLEGEGRMEGEGGLAAFNSSCMGEWDTRRFERSALQLFRLHDVYVNSHGGIFTAQYQFHRLACHTLKLFTIQPNQHVTRISSPFLLWHYDYACHNYYHFLVDALPVLIVGLRALNGSLPVVRVMADEMQWRWYRKVGRYLTGLSAYNSKLKRIFTPTNRHLVLAATVYQPSFQLCWNPSVSLWSFLRRHHLLHPSGIPMFHASDLTARDTVPLTDHQMAALPADWLVIFFQRQGSRRVEQEEEMVGMLQEAFGQTRVTTVTTIPNITHSRALFRRAGLFVAPHGAALTNMVFMPLNSSVLEIRPKDMIAGCYRQLAAACSLNYYLSLGEGNKSTSLQMNVQDVMRKLNHIKVKLKLV